MCVNTFTLLSSPSNISEIFNICPKFHDEMYIINKIGENTQVILLKENIIAKELYSYI